MKKNTFGRQLSNKSEWLVISLLLLFSTKLHAQNVSKVTVGEIKAVHSKILGEERELYIYLPESYTGSTFRYPTLYLLDAEYEFVPTVGAVEFMAGAGKIPEIIVVGIVNTNRSRDLTPEATNDKESQEFWGEIGGAENFRKFIIKELIPYVEKKYRTDGYKVLRGQSFGGLFGLFDYFKSNSIFNAYILTSPTVRWNENALFDELKQFKYLADDKRKLYLGEAEFDSGTNTGIRDFAQLFQNIVYNADYFWYDFYKEETHYSLTFEATQKGLSYLYKNWKLNRQLLAGGDFTELMNHFEEVSDEFGYPLKAPMKCIVDFENSQLRKKNYDLAIEIAQKHIELYPQQPETYWHLGDAYNFKNEYENALKYYTIALEKARELDLSDLEEYKSSIERARAKLK